MTDCCIHTSDIARWQHLLSAGCYQLLVPGQTPALDVRLSGPTAWNSLPDYLQDLSRSFDCFLGALKTFLILVYTAH